MTTPNNIEEIELPDYIKSNLHTQPVTLNAIPAKTEDSQEQVTPEDLENVAVNDTIPGVEELLSNVNESPTSPEKPKIPVTSTVKPPVPPVSSIDPDPTIVPQKIKTEPITQQSNPINKMDAPAPNPVKTDIEAPEKPHIHKAPLKKTAPITEKSLKPATATKTQPIPEFNSKQIDNSNSEVPFAEKAPIEKVSSTPTEVPTPTSIKAEQKQESIIPEQNLNENPQHPVANPQVEENKTMKQEIKNTVKSVSSSVKPKLREAKQCFSDKVKDPIVDKYSHATPKQKKCVLGISLGVLTGIVAIGVLKALSNKR